MRFYSYKKMKPKKCCYPDCYICPYKDCINNDLHSEEIIIQNNFDSEVLYERKGSKEKKIYLYFKNYIQSEKGKEAVKRYAKSEKGKENQRRYLATDKGKRMLEKKYKKYIESGKNAEKCRRYREKKKLEKLLSID